ncbi:MAG: aryl-sulfate sulfotransferase, partial [Ignavibacteria bacterium]|nr:aryl-sulfate sulfotransferase [Ignavibacteria bacterium]
MKYQYTNCLTIVILFISILFIPIRLSAQQEISFQYVSPKPNSLMVSNETNIILRHDTKLQESTIIQSLVTVVGSISGHHTGDFLLTDDDQTIVFNPHKAFAFNEVVTVSIQRGIKTLNDFELPYYSFSFTTESDGIVQVYDGVFDEDNTMMQNIYNTMGEDNALTSTLPAPPITIDSLNNPGPGYIFMATWDRNVPQMYGNFIFILDNVGHIVDSVRVDGAPFNFKVQPNGLLSYAKGDFSINVPLPGEELQHMILDSTLAVVDSVKMKNGYRAIFHEFLMLPNGHVMMVSFHTIIFDMSTIVPGGQTNCELVISIIQEQDTERNVVFEWRNIDYIPITDNDLDLTTPRVSFGTINAFDIDNDGNILASFRNHSEIMKINRATGEIMWRMGSPRGEFTYVGEHEENAPYYHARQHNIQRHSNGNITLFDNGEFHTPPYSRG